MRLSVTSKFRHKVKSLFGKRADDCSTSRPLRCPISKEKLDVLSSWMSLRYSTSGNQRHMNVRHKFFQPYITWTCWVKGSVPDVVIIRCSEVPHGVRLVCQTGMKSQMHGLWIRHDSRRLLLLSPPQTRCLRVQVPLLDLTNNGEVFNECRNCTDSNYFLLQCKKNTLTLREIVGKYLMNIF